MSPPCESGLFEHRDKTAGLSPTPLALLTVNKNVRRPGRRGRRTLGRGVSSLAAVPCRAARYAAVRLR